MPNDRAKSEGTLTHLRTWWSIWSLHHSIKTGAKETRFPLKNSLVNTDYQIISLLLKLLCSFAVIFVLLATIWLQKKWGQEFARSVQYSLMYIFVISQERWKMREQPMWYIQLSWWTMKIHIFRKNFLMKKCSKYAVSDLLKNCSQQKWRLKKQA